MRLSAASDDATQDGEEQETADTTSNADYEVLVVVDPAADFLGCCRAFALALWSISRSHDTTWRTVQPTF